jgi:hypothetical protein
MKQPKSADEPTMYLSLKAPVSFFERLDRWCEQQKKAQGMTIRPSRPAAIRYILHNFLLKEEERAKRNSKRRK